MSGDQAVHDVQDFQRDVVEASREIPVVVDFWAEWCAPCRVLGPVLEKLAAEADGRWRLAKVDTEAFPSEAARYGIRGIPNVKLFMDGDPVDEFTGALPEAEVRAWLDRALPTEEDREAERAVEEARQVLLGEPKRALELLKGAEPRIDDPDEVADLRFLAELVLRLEDPGHLEETEAGRLYVDAIRNLQREAYDEALGGFIEAFRKDRTLDDEGPRRACVALFRFLGHEDPIVRRRRAELARALYS